MAYSPSLADRLRDCLDRYPHITDKRMFGGLGFFYQGNMLVGIWKESLVLRLGYEQASECKANWCESLQPHRQVSEGLGDDPRGQYRR